MNLKFWLLIVIQQVMMVCQLIVLDTTLTPAVKAGIEKLLADGEALIPLL
jgi:hypothetical protein